MVTKHLRWLNTRTPPRPGAPRHLGAASGLVQVGHTLFVAADDENALGAFPATGTGPGKWIRLWDAALPAGAAARKAKKPDLESLTVLPPAPEHPHGALLAVGSGSTANRCRAVLLTLDAIGRPRPPARTVDMAPFFAGLSQDIPDLNIEGAVVLGDALRLLQRGNGKKAFNAWVDADLNAVTHAAAGDSPVPASALRAIMPVELGDLGGVPLGFTDASPLPDGRVVFAAAAEDTESTYDDGECRGSVLGTADKKGRILAMHRLDRPDKIEGVHVTGVSGITARVLLVADNDDPSRPAPLLVACLDGL